MKICPKCRQTFDDTWQVCLSCETPLVLSQGDVKRSKRRRSLTTEEIAKHINYLHSKLPQPATPAKEAFRLPENIRHQLQRELKQDTLQEAAQVIAAYLGLLSPIAVKLGIESSAHMMMGGGDADRLDRTGLYKVSGSDHGYIEITSKYHYEIKHVLAILAHESIHNFLYKKGIRYEDEEENEILTDLASAYLGLGYLVYAGYQPITWTEDWQAGSYVSRTITIGYVTPDSIRRAIPISVKIRDLDVKSVLSDFARELDIWGYIRVYFSLVAHIRAKKKLSHESKLRQREMESSKKIKEELLTKTQEVQRKYKNLKNAYQNLGAGTVIPQGEEQVGIKIVEIENKISTGEVENSIIWVIDRLMSLRAEDISSKEIELISIRVSQLESVIKAWQDILNKLGIQS